MPTTAATRVTQAGVVLAGTVVAGGCLLTTDLDGFSRPRSDPGGDAEPLDASDAGAADVRAIDAPDASPPAFCTLLPASAAFCDDFDRTDLLGNWTRAVADPPGELTISREGDPFLHARVPAKDTVVRAFLSRELTPIPKSRLSFEFDVRFSETPSERVQVMALSIGTAPDYVNVMLMAGPAMAISEQRFGANAVYNEHLLATTPSPGVVHRMQMVIDFRAPVAHLSIKLDDVGVDEHDSQANLTPERVIVNAGVFYGMPTPAVDLAVDRVLVTIE